ncbi:MAG: winged helix-turn-helix transcriptional regulator [Candidatus Geothermarchaeales archaeon]
MSEIDLGILKILRENSRASISTIAKRLGVSRPTVRSRMSRLKSMGIIKKYTIILDESVTSEKISFFIGITTEKPRDVTENLLELDGISEAYLTSGDKNLICRADVSDMEEFKELMEKIYELKVGVESNIVLKPLKRKEIEVEPDIAFRLNCDFCGNEIAGKVHTYKRHRREYFFCCPTCLEKFKERFSI